LIDKIYEYEQENEKLTHVIEQLQSENHLIDESIQSLQKKFEALKDENEEYKLLIIDYEEALMRMKSKEGDHSMEKHQENQNYE
jgi:septal ring factor EnvC (AmiA/AmiB activator)